MFQTSQVHSDFKSIVTQMKGGYIVCYFVLSQYFFKVPKLILYYKITIVRLSQLEGWPFPSYVGGYVLLFVVYMFQAKQSAGSRHKHNFLLNYKG